MFLVYCSINSNNVSVVTGSSFISVLLRKKQNYVIKALELLVRNQSTWFLLEIILRIEHNDTFLFLCFLLQSFLSFQVFYMCFYRYNFLGFPTSLSALPLFLFPDIIYYPFLSFPVQAPTSTTTRGGDLYYCRFPYLYLVDYVIKTTDMCPKEIQSLRLFPSCFFLFLQRTKSSEELHHHLVSWVLEMYGKMTCSFILMII